MEEDLFDEDDQDPLSEYMSMETILGEGEHKEPRYEAQNSFGLVMTGFKKEERNLNPTVWEALAGEDKRFWEEAMCKELKGLEAMNTWETTDLPCDTNTVDTRWVLKIKTDANLIPTKYKARLVAQGFMQREGIDYMEIFAPVAPIQLIRGVLVIAAMQDWEVDSIDVKQAYLNSSLHHDVYLKPPIGTKVPPGKVLKLMKGLYADCHGPGCSRSRRVMGSYGRSTGIEDLVEISREHGRSAVSMETMDSYGLTCKGGPSTATRKTKLKEQAQPRRGPSSRSMQMVTTQGLERQEPKELTLIKGGGAVSKESTPGHEEEEQCRRS
ncbi:hypothetical protein NDA15_001382 [Ustilago hordei]|nr:hypothetical protein NDA15_001382 [Ustilago hordei]